MLEVETKKTKEGHGFMAHGLVVCAFVYRLTTYNWLETPDKVTNWLDCWIACQLAINVKLE